MIPSTVVRLLILLSVLTESVVGFAGPRSGRVLRRRRGALASPAEEKVAKAEGGMDESSGAFSNPVPVLGEIFSTMYSPSAAGTENQRIKFGVFKEAVSASEAAAVAPADAARRRTEAAASLTNIDDAERARRKTVGTAMSGATLALAAALPLAGVPMPGRFAAELFPVFLSRGFLASAEEGL